MLQNEKKNEKKSNQWNNGLGDEPVMSTISSLQAKFRDRPHNREFNNTCVMHSNIYWKYDGTTSKNLEQNPNFGSD